MTDQPPRLRVAAVGIVALSLFAALFARLYYLQVLDPRTIEEVRGSQLFRTVSYEGERGRILDRTGKVLVDNREAVDITIDRQQYEAIGGDAQRHDLLVRLARTLNTAGVPMKVEDIEARLADKRYDPFKPVPIAEDVSPALEVYLLERADQFPSVGSARVDLRSYPQGALAAHVLGYVGAINADELESKKQSAKAYDPGDEIGKTGVERIFEDDLRGTPGRRLIEVDARNVEVGTQSVVPPKPGADVQLTIDADLQRAVEGDLAKSLADARARPKRKPDDPDVKAPAGAVVVLNVKTGELLALASYPSYNPADFVGGISSYRFAELNDPAAHAPLNDRAVSSSYAPGSTFKMLTAYTALATGLVDPDEQIRDGGSWTIADCQAAGGAGCTFTNAGKAAYGKVDLRRALTVSSDVYFYRLGELFWNSQARLGQVPIQNAARAFGFGAPTGVQLTDEGSGNIDDPQQRAARHDDNPTAFPNGDWFTGDNVNLAIGQGELGVTPLQLANAYATLANGGTLLSPSVVKAVIDHQTGAVERTFPPRVRATVPLPPEIRQPLVDGLTGVVAKDEGTAAAGFAGFPLDVFPVAGKTGTAEVDPGKKADTSLFAAFGPVNDPTYAVVAVMEESGFGADVAVPLVRQVFDRLKGPVPGEPAATAGSTPSTTAPTDGTASGGSNGDATATSASAVAPSTSAAPSGVAPGDPNASPADASTTAAVPPGSAAPAGSAGPATTGPATAPSDPSASVAPSETSVSGAATADAATPADTSAGSDTSSLSAQAVASSVDAPARPAAPASSVPAATGAPAVRGGP